MERTHRHFVLGVVLASLAAATVQAESPSNAPAKPASGSEGRPGMGTTESKSAVKAEKAAEKADKAAVKAEKAADKADKAADKASDKADKAEERADKAEQRADKAEKRADSAGADAVMPGKHGSSAGMPKSGFRSGLRTLSEGVRDGSVKREELKERLEKLRSSMAERRREHREAIRSRWGSALASAPGRDEVRLHGRRMAMLNRALFLAQTEAKAPNQEKLLERIEKLIQRENTRHERAMANIKSMPAPANTVAVNTPGTIGNPSDPSAANAKQPSGQPMDKGAAK